MDRNRRRLLKLTGMAGAATLLPATPAAAQDTGAAPAGCIVVPRQTDGPYFLDTRLERADIRSDPEDGTLRPGLPLRLVLDISRLREEQCSPLADAVVDLWQCDAVGEYSGVRDRLYDTRGQAYLRGYQRSDRNGRVEFMTIYPGWYPSRAVHIHIKVRIRPDAAQGEEFATQLYFDDDFTDRVFAETTPYAGRDERPTRNADDRIFQRGDGEQLILRPEPDGPGLRAAFSFALRGRG